MAKVGLTGHQTSIIMQEQEFRKLLDKYLDGSISDKEKQLLKQFEEELDSWSKLTHFIDPADNVKVKASIWKKVSRRTTRVAPRYFNWKTASSSAAVIIGLLVVGYVYFQNSGQLQKGPLPQNAITLEMEDGSVRIIEENSLATLTNSKGAVLGQQKGNEIVYSDAEVGDELVYNTLKVPFGKRFELSLSDGTKAYLNAGSSLKYPVKFLRDRDRNVYITGEAFLEVAKDSLRPFIVNTEKMNVRVLGTKFNVSSYPEDDNSEVVLVEGAVSLYKANVNYDPREEVLLRPGFKGSFSKKSNEISKDSVITSLYTSWMKGELIFRNMSFSNIIKKLERHYNVTIVNNNTALAAKKFNANFGEAPLEKVLQELQANYGVEYTINDQGDITIQ